MVLLSGGSRTWSITATGTVCLVLLVTLLNLFRQSNPESRAQGSMRAYVPQAVVTFQEEKYESLDQEEYEQISQDMREQLMQTEEPVQEFEDLGHVITWQSLKEDIRPAEWWVETLIEFSARASAYPEVFTSIPEKAERYMVLVEPRRYDLMEHVLRNFVFYLAPKGWGLVICHGPDNSAYVRRVVRGWSYVHLLQMEALGSGVQRHEYSRLLVSAPFWSSLPGSVQLLFQTDCFLRDDSLEHWLAYDYVGAPWANWVEHRLRGKVGNGGFSLRKKEAMLRCIEEVSWDQSSNEDIFFSLDCAHRLRIPGEQEALEFVVETLWDDKRPPLGFHHAWQYLEYDRQDLHQNRLYQVMRHYNVQPFLERVHISQPAGDDARQQQ